MKVRKIAGIVAAAVMTVAMGITAMAAPSPSVNGTVSVSTATDKDGNAVQAAVSESEKTITAEEIQKVTGEEGLQLADVKDVTVPEGTQFPVTITFNVAGVTSSSKVAVLHWNGSEWEKVSSTPGEGTITATFTSLSPVAFVVDKTTSAAATTTSPKTGEASTVVVLGFVAVLAAGAVYGISKKSRA